MRLILTLGTDGHSIVLPIHYNHWIQAAIYQSLSSPFATFLHDSGYQIENRTFKLFSFSRLIGSYQILPEKKQIRFTSPLKLVISSPVPEFIHNMSQILLKDGLQLGKQLLPVTSVQLLNPQVNTEQITVQTLSPVVAYSSLFRQDGSKYTLYYEPNSSDFQRIVSGNLLRKARFLYGQEVESASMECHPIGKHKQHIIMYKEHVIKAYSGRFRLYGDSRLLQTAIDDSIGSKGSMGFGLVELVHDIQKEGCT